MGPKACPACGSRYPADALFCPIDGSPLQNASQLQHQQAHASPVDPYLGREMLGHIEIRQLAGVGAMGRVYRAFQKGIDRDVAVKILHRELSTNQQLVARFHREAKVASRLQHQNVVHVYLTGQLPDGAMYIVMEYLDGLSLQSALMASQNAFPLPRALTIALQLCDAAGEAHAHGIVHRDIKPENVMLVRRGDDEDFVKVLDFGIARLNWGEQSMATAAGLIFGTARYISPEGAQGEGVGPAGDVYAIATLLFQMLSGRTPFEGDQAVALLVQQIHDQPPHLKSIPRAAYVPDAIADVVMRNLAKAPGERAQDGRTFGRALIEAAKISGLAPEEFVSRSMLLGGRGTSFVSLPPMQRTRQMQLEPELAERIGAPRTSYESPSQNVQAHQPRTEAGLDVEPPSFPPPSRGPHALPPSAATTKWTPPPGFSARLNQDTPPPARSSSVDVTLDEANVAPPMPPPPSATYPVAPPSRPISAPPHRAPTPVPPAPPSVPPHRTQMQSKPPSSVDSTLSDEEAADLARRNRIRAVLLVLCCFLLGVAGATGIAYKLGLFRQQAQSLAAAKEAQIAKANRALGEKRWDSPAGDNVRDLTDEGLVRWPNDSQLLRVRELACDDIVREARRKWVSGDLTEALRLARLAHELDPTDEDAKELFVEYEEHARVPPLGLGGDGGLAPLASLKPSGSTAPGAARVVVDASPGRPRLGQPVDFVARVLGTKVVKVEAAEFHISGPGLHNVTLPAAGGDVGPYRGGFTPLDNGRYEITFSAKVDGAVVRSSKTFFAGDAPPEPMPSASGKWL